MSREVAVFGIPDLKWGEIVKAVVVLKPEKTLTAEELIASCRRSLTNFKVPRSIEFPDRAAKERLRQNRKEVAS
jgi:acyl-CoA synthetase (AMP-forming)/AMP-acid ligase II